MSIYKYALRLKEEEMRDERENTNMLSNDYPERRKRKRKILFNLQILQYINSVIKNKLPLIASMEDRTQTFAMVGRGNES